MNPVYETLILDRKIPVPLYYQLKQFMVEHINNNDLREGEIVPPEEELCLLLKVSRPTVRQAFTELAAEGYLDRVKAKGTYITKPKIKGGFIQEIQSFNQEMESLGVVPQTEVLSFKETSTYPEVLEQLNLPSGSKVLRLERVRYADGVPVVYVKTYLPSPRFKKLLKEDLSQLSLYETLNEKFDTSIYDVERRITAVTADESVAALLKIQTGEPLLYVSTVARDQSDIAIEYSVASYRSDHYEMKIEMKRNRDLL